MKRAVLVTAMLGCAHRDGSELRALEREATAVVDATRPSLDALVARIDVLKRELRGNLPGWQDMLRVAELANNQLGLPPFTQVVAATAEFRPSPATLLGMGPYVRVRAVELARHGKHDELAFLVADELRRYDHGITETEGLLDEVERRLETARGGKKR